MLIPVSSFIPTTSMFSNLKDKVEKNVNSCLVYRINCLNRSLNYYGIKLQYLHKRLYQREEVIPLILLCANTAYKNIILLILKWKVLESLQINVVPRTVDIQAIEDTATSHKFFYKNFKKINFYWLQTYQSYSILFPCCYQIKKSYFIDLWNPFTSYQIFNSDYSSSVFK